MTTKHVALNIYGQLKKYYHFACFYNGILGIQKEQTRW